MNKTMTQANMLRGGSPTGYTSGQRQYAPNYFASQPQAGGSNVRQPAAPGGPPPGHTGKYSTMPNSGYVLPSDNGVSGNVSNYDKIVDRMCGQLQSSGQIPPNSQLQGQLTNAYQPQGGYPAGAPPLRNAPPSNANPNNTRLLDYEDLNPGGPTGGGNSRRGNRTQGIR